LIDYLIYVILPQVLHGLVWGTVIAFIALGLTIIFGLMDIVNFAQASTTWWEPSGVHGHERHPEFLDSRASRSSCVAVLGLFTEFILFRRLYGRDPIFHLLLTFGLGMMFREAAQLIWGAETKRMEVPVTATVELLGTVYPVYRLLILGIGICVILSYGICCDIQARARRSGRWPRKDDGLGAGNQGPADLYVGLRRRCRSCRVRGDTHEPINFVYPTMGVDVILRAFIVVVIGGLGNVMGALFASLLIGEVEALASIWISPTIAETLVFVILIITMIVRPAGLFGKAGER
jgi:branched-subunit amino acid ABC-type transport system permease component